MKRIIISIAIFLFAATSCYSQQDDFKIESTCIYTGEGSLASGLTNTTFFGWKENTIEVDLNTSMGQVLFVHNFTSTFSSGPTWGFFDNTMWVGPVLELTFLRGHITTLNWVGWSFGDAQEKSTKAEVKFMFSYQQIDFRIGNPVGTNVDFWAAKQNYYKTNENIIGLKFNMQFNKKFAGFWGWGYMDHAQKHLWNCGFSYNFK